MRIVCRPGATAYSTRSVWPASTPSMNTSPNGSAAMVRKPWASAARAACRGFTRSGRRCGSRLACAGTRTVSAEGAGSCSLLPLSARYPPTPAATHRGALALLGRHVMRRADDHPGRGEPRGGLERLRDPEVREHHATVVVEHDVGGLHVAVHHTALVRVSQGAGRFPENALDLGDGQRLLLLEQILERGTRDVFHHEVVEPTLTLDAIDGDDVGVVELGGGLGLLLEAAHHLIVLGDIGREHLDRDLPLEREIVRQEHGAHPALAQQPLDPVLALDHAPQPLLHDGDAAGAGGSVPPRDVGAARRAELAVLGNRGVAAEAFEHAVGHRRLDRMRSGGTGKFVLQKPPPSTGTVPTQTSYVVAVPAKSTTAT